MLRWSICGTQLAVVVSIVQTVVVTPLPTGDGLSCPRLCFCNAASHIVYCSRRGLASIPAGIPVSSLQLNLNGNVFESAVMRRVNLSSFVHLEHLYLSECRLEVLEVGAFVDLTALRWLDLSNNRLRAVLPDTFRGLHLQHLFLNGNRHVQLSAGSFAGLLTVGLYLHDCSLTDMSADLLAPLNTTLRYLWLNGNELDSLDVQLADSFAPLHHLRLGSNPLRCDCGAAWLRSFFDDHVDAFRGALPPSCLRPARLRGRPLAQVDPADLRCRPPSFTALEIRFDESASRRLLCTAVGDPTPTLYWIQPSGRTTRHERATRNVDDMEQVEAVLELTSDDNDDDDTSMSGLYTCIANNDVGNVTMTVVIPAQRRPLPVLRHNSLLAAAATPLADTTITTTTMLPASTPAILQSIMLGDSLLQLQRLAASHAPSPPPYSLIGGRRGNLSSADPAQHDHPVPVATDRARFSSAEMACAVVVTHISTLLLCIVVVILHRRRGRLCLAGGFARKTRHRQRRFSLPGDGGGLRAAYERRLPWTSPATRCPGADEKTSMSLDRATSVATLCPGADEKTSMSLDRATSVATLCPGTDEKTSMSLDRATSVATRCPGADEKTSMSLDRATSVATRCPGTDEKTSMSLDRATSVATRCPGTDEKASMSLDRATSVATRCPGSDEKASMSLDRATSVAASETVSFNRGVRQYTLNDYYTDVR